MADNNIAIMIPNPECVQTFGILAIALKDVPPGFPFWIVEDSEIPTDRTFRDAWEIPEGWGSPDGYGSQYNTFEEIENAQDKQ